MNSHKWQQCKLVHRSEFFCGLRKTRKLMMVNPGLQLSVAHLNLKQPLSIILLLESLINHKTDLYITISCDRT